MNKKTFAEFAVNVGKSRALGEIVMGFIRSIGIGTEFSNREPERFMEEAMRVYPDSEIVIYVEKYPSYSDMGYYIAERTSISILDLTQRPFTDLIDKLIEPDEKPITIKLNDSYTAEISPDKKTVKVGCTTFDAERVKEVARALGS